MLFKDKECGNDLINKIKNVPIFKFDRVIKCNDVLKRDQTLNVPQLVFELNPNSLYTIVMTDPDAPISKMMNKQWLHWLVINTRHTIVPYSPPNPPKGSGNHRYFVSLFKQKKLIPSTNYTREDFDIIKFVNDNSLELQAFTKFIVASPK
jgi:Phospholipid-binding protein